MVIPAHIQWNSFYAITNSRIIPKFFTAHAPLDFCTFMYHFGYYYFCNSLKNLRFALLLIWAASTLIMQKGNGTLITLFHIRAIFREKLLDDERTNDHVDRSIRSGYLITV